MFDPYEHFLLHVNLRSFYVIVLHGYKKPAFYFDTEIIDGSRAFHWTFILPDAFKFQTEKAAENLANEYLYNRTIEVVKIESNK